MSAECRSCGAAIVWARTTGGKMMPLDAKMERRMVITDSVQFPEPVVKQVETYVSHFATCPQADEHRKP